MEILNIKNNLLKKQEAPSRQSGFTLVELMVSLTLFTIVVLAAVGSLYTVNNASRRVQAMRSVIDNLNFGLESMSRTIRTGNTVVCGGASNTTSLDPIVSANPNCSFANQNPGTNLLVDSTLGLDQLVEYQIAKPNGTGVIQKRTREGGTWSNWIDITAPEIDIKNLSFYVDGASSSDTIQPNVMIFVQGIAVAGQETAPFAIQTYLTQRAVE